MTSFRDVTDLILLSSNDGETDNAEFILFFFYLYEANICQYCQDYVKLSRIVLFCKPNRKISPATLARVAPWELGTVSKHYGMNERKKHMASEFVNLCRSD